MNIMIIFKKNNSNVVRTMVR